MLRDASRHSSLSSRFALPPHPGACRHQSKLHQTGHSSDLHLSTRVSSPHPRYPTCHLPFLRIPLLCTPSRPLDVLSAQHGPLPHPSSPCLAYFCVQTSLCPPIRSRQMSRDPVAEAVPRQRRSKCTDRAVSGRAFERFTVE